MKLFVLVYSALLLFIPFFALSQNYEIEQTSVVRYSETINRTGILAYKKVINLSFKSNGYLTKLKVDEGDTFIEKQTLASLDVSELIEDKNARYALLLQAKSDFNRQKDLLKKKLNTQRELDLANTQLTTRRSEHKVALYNLLKAQIIAPFKGVVLSLNTQLGELQSPGREVITVAPLTDNMIVKISLTGEEISNVRLNQKVSVELNRLGKIEGVISKIPAIANVNGHLFEIEISLPSLAYQQGVIAGQLAEVVIEFTNENLVYQLPIKALVSISDTGQAFILTKNSINQTFSHQSFDIYQFDNDYVYLVATIDAPTLSVITKGWQNISMDEQ